MMEGIAIEEDLKTTANNFHDFSVCNANTKIKNAINSGEVLTSLWRPIEPKNIEWAPFGSIYSEKRRNIARNAWRNRPLGLQGKYEFISSRLW